MAFLDRFKSQKAQDIQESTGAKNKPTEKSTSTAKKAAPKKAVAKKTDSKVKTEKKIVSTDKRLSGTLTTVIKRPLVTEKSARLATDGKYSFVVRNNATRVEIGQAIRAMYGIVPVSVNVQNVHGKHQRDNDVPAT